MLRNKRFKGLSIPQKLVVMIMASSLLFLVMGTSCLLSLEIYRMRNSILNDVTILADITGSNCAAPLVFNDSKAALETLNSLRFHNGIIGATVRDTAGFRLASYARSDSGEADLGQYLSQEGHDFTFRELHVYREIVVDNEPVGSINIVYDLSAIHLRIFEYFILMLALFISMTLLCRVLANKLQAFISLPIQKLGETARKVSESKDYSLRASKESDDETGDLVERFNEMLALIEVRDRALQERKNALEEEVSLRTAELIKERDKAEQATLSKSRFLANMSHEIRTPMIGVLGMSELLREQDYGPDSRQMVETIYSSSVILMEILNDILDFSKIEAEHFELHLSATDLKDLLQNVVNLMAVNARRKGLDIHLKTPPKVPILQADPMLIRQILLNLIGNAVKFTEAGEIAVELSLEKRGAGGIYDCHIQVRDSGIGIPPEMHRRIFESFDQGDNPLAKKASGTGLGLSIVKNLVALMDGSVTVSSLPGEGSTFTVCLPLVLFDAAVGSLPHERRPLETASDTPVLPPANGRNWQVLIAEDNPTTQNLLKILFQRLSINLFLVNDGQEAIDFLTKERVDLILMDCQMPKLDGLAATKQLRELGVTTPIIALTAYARSEDKEECLSAGMDDYLRKPFRQSDLQQVLARWLDSGLTEHSAQED